MRKMCQCSLSFEKGMQSNLQGIRLYISLILGFGNSERSFKVGKISETKAED
jgi:hypothetical protein